MEIYFSRRTLNFTRLKLLAYAILLVCIIGATVSLASAAPLVIITPAKQCIKCGSLPTVAVSLSGVVWDFGNAMDEGTYTIHMYESDIADDDHLFHVYGRYPDSTPDVDNNDPVAFLIVFELNCSADCLKLCGERVVSLKMSIKGGAWKSQEWQPIRKDGAIGKGNYTVQTYCDSDECSSAPCGFELTMCFKLSQTNYGNAELTCCPVGGVTVSLNRANVDNSFPYFTATSTILVVTIASSIYIRRVKRREQSKQ